MRSLNHAHCVAAVVALIAAAGSAHAGIRALYTNIATSPTSLIPGGGGLRFSLGTQTQFDRPYVSANGQYFIFTALAEHPVATEDEFVIVGQLGGGMISAANAVAREGVTALEPGRLIESASIGRNAAINDSGEFVFQANLSGLTTDDELIVKGSNFLAPSLNITAREGQSVGALGSPIVLGATLDSPGINSSGKVSYRATLTGAPTGQTSALLLDDGNTLAAQAGVTIPTGQAGGGVATWQNFGADDFYLSGNGSTWLAAGDTNAATTADNIVAVNNAVQLQEDSTVPGLGNPALIASFAESVMGSGGNWMTRGALDGGTDFVAYNGMGIAMTDDAVPGGLPGETIDDTSFTATFFSLATNGVGDHVYGAVTSNPDLTANAVLVWNDSFVVVREGDAVDIDGNGLFDDNAFISVFNNDDMFLTDDNYLYFFADLRDGAGASIGQAFVTLQVPAPSVAGLALAFGIAGMRRRR